MYRIVSLLILLDMASKPRVIFALLGTTLDTGKGPERWERWRPTVALCQHEDLAVSRLELLHGRPSISLCNTVVEDIASVSPETTVNRHMVEFRDPWDFEEVYATLHDFARGYKFDPEREEYLVHITTGTHVAQICLFLLTEARYFPGVLLQTSPPQRARQPGPGQYKVIDLDLSRYDSIAARFRTERRDNVAGLKSGIATRNAAFNRLIDELEHVAAHSTDPILLMGPTGAGKSQLARRLFELKQAKHLVKGSLVEVNCATLRGDAAMSVLFGHKKGAFTGAVQDRAGLLRAADGGLLFLDEIGELGLDEQAMLLRALEEKRFLPLGSDVEATSDFRLIAGTNRDLSDAVRRGRFREDLLARINLWTFRLPPLKERREDIEPNLDYELEQFSRRTGRSVRLNREARDRFLAFAMSARAHWNGNFRDLSAAITRMGTLAPGGRITTEVVEAESARLSAAWGASESDAVGARGCLEAVLSPADLDRLDLFDRVQLAEVLRVCRACSTLSEAGRTLFAASRQSKVAPNDADRLRKYLARFGLSWARIRAAAHEPPDAARRAVSLE